MVLRWALGAVAVVMLVPRYLFMGKRTVSGRVDTGSSADALPFDPCIDALFENYLTSCLEKMHMEPALVERIPKLLQSSLPVAELTQSR